MNTADMIISIIKKKRNPQTSFEIRSKLLRNGVKITDAQLRQRIRKLVVDGGQPIISCTNGFLLAYSNEEIDIGIKYIQARIKPMLNRIKCLAKMKKTGQYEMGI